MMIELLRSAHFIIQKDRDKIRAQKKEIAELKKQLKAHKRLLFKANKELDLYNCHELALDYIATQEKSDG
ncbi:MAG: hypothetical protein GY941_21265 [Planctomycetes bacterium]|nr:hypothetical protein [Planctomycetota bacterium]